MASAAATVSATSVASPSRTTARGPTRAACARCARAVPWVSFWGNLGLAIYKLFVGIFGGSTALIADAAHSFADVVGSVGIVVATRVSGAPADDAYPYGRGKAEFLGAVFVYTVLLFFAGGIVFHSVVLMFSDNLTAPHFVTLLGAVASVIHNVIMYQYLTCVGKRNNSPAILADAFENRADAISSVACIAGIVGALTVHPICDPIAALLVGVIILWNCQEQLRDAMKGLMDVALPEEDLAEARDVVLGCKGVEGIAFLRTRRTGARYWLDVGVEVADYLGIDQADKIAAAVHHALMRYPFCHYVEVFVVPHGGEVDAGGGALQRGETDASDVPTNETDAGEADANEADAGEADANEADANEADANEADANEAGEAAGEADSEADASPSAGTDEEAEAEAKDGDA